jgi:hypothetical protein
LAPPSGRGGVPTKQMPRYLLVGSAGEGRLYQGFSSDLPAAPISGSTAFCWIGAAPLLKGGAKRVAQCCLKNDTSRFTNTLKSPAGLHLLAIPTVYFGQVCLVMHLRIVSITDRDRQKWACQE